MASLLSFDKVIHQSNFAWPDLFHKEILPSSHSMSHNLYLTFLMQALGQKGGPQYSRFHHVTGKTTLYDMELDLSRKHILTACQDRSIRVYNVSNGKHSKTFKGTLGEEGTLIKVSPFIIFFF